MNTIAIFGATGGTGRVLTELALEKGLRVRALARNPEKLNLDSESLDIIQGDALDSQSVSEVIDGADAVFSCLGHSKGSPQDLQERALQLIISEMQKQGVKRLINLTGSGVRFAGDEPGLMDKFFTFALKLIDRPRMVDGENHVRLIVESDLDWTVVRTPLQTNAPARGELKVGPVNSQSGFKISRQDIAKFMLDCYSERKHIQDAPAISW